MEDRQRMRINTLSRGKPPFLGVCAKIMILSQIKQYLRERRAATLEELARHFQTEPATMRDMLEHWIRKGSIRQKMERAGCCQRCRLCEETPIEVYEWILPPEFAG